MFGGGGVVMIRGSVKLPRLNYETAPSATPMSETDETAPSAKSMPEADTMTCSATPTPEADEMAPSAKSTPDYMTAPQAGLTPVPNLL